MSPTTLVHELVDLSHDLVRAVQAHDPGRLETMLARAFTLLGAAGVGPAREVPSPPSGGRSPIEFFAY